MGQFLVAFAGQLLAEASAAAVDGNVHLFPGGQGLLPGLHIHVQGGHGVRVLGQILAVFLLIAFRHIIHQRLIPVLAPQGGVASGADHGNIAAVYVHHRDVKGAAA